MNKIQQLKFFIDSLCVYNVKEDEVVSSLYSLLENAENENVYTCFSKFFNSLIRHGDSLKHYISELILYGDNAFTKKAACSGIDGISEVLKEAVKSDLEKLEAISDVSFADLVSDENNVSGSLNNGFADEEIQTGELPANEVIRNRR